MGIEIPKGATHKHDGNEMFLPHFIKVEDEVHIWVAGEFGGDYWSDLPAHDDIENYRLLTK